MTNKAPNFNAEKDVDLLKAVISASGGINGKGTVFWKDVASAMSEGVTGEAARKRFDKYKPGAGSSKAKAKAKANFEKDSDLLTAVIKVNGGANAKGKDFWEKVAAGMEEKITREAARKRFDKFRVKGSPRGGGDTATAGVKIEQAKKAVPKPKAPKITARKVRALDSAVDLACDEERHDGSTGKMNDGFEEHEKDGYFMAETDQDAGAFGEYVAGGSGPVSKKRAWVDEWVEDVSSTGIGEEEQDDLDHLITLAEAHPDDDLGPGYT